jgi:peptidyl-prolyl cis-trans isomerase SurA
MKIVLVAIAIAGSVFAAPEGAAAPRTGVQPKTEITVVARVNGEAVTGAELQRMLNDPSIRPQLEQESGASAPGQKELETLALRRLIRRRLMLQEGRRRNMSISDEELDRGVASLRRRFEDLRSFGMWMKEAGLDDRSLFDTIREEMLAARVAGALVSEVRVTEEQIQKYYEAHREELRTEEVWVQIIAVKSRADAEEIQAALARHEDFGRLAQQRSVGIRAVQGGDAGWLSAETLWPPMRDAVSTLKPGEAIGPLQRGDEFLIVRLHGRRQGRTKNLDEARRQIERALLAQEQRTAIQQWVAEQEKKSNIDVLPSPSTRQNRIAGSGSLEMN